MKFFRRLKLARKNEIDYKKRNPLEKQKIARKMKLV